MDERWRIRKVEIRGGFLDGISLELPGGLTCIIGPRGSGKSTFAEAVRYALTGAGTHKDRKELYQSNLSRAVVTVGTAPIGEGIAYIIRREGRQPALVSTSGGMAIQVDLDRGTFLPLDGYISKEIEEYADEAFGGARRALIDDLEPVRMPVLRDDAQRTLRSLHSNADDIRSCRREKESLVEEEQSLAHVPDLLAALPAPAPGDTTAQRLQEAARQAGYNSAEKKSVAAATDRLIQLSREIVAFRQRSASLATTVFVAESANAPATRDIDHELSKVASRLDSGLGDIEDILNGAVECVSASREELEHRHQQQAADFASLKDANVQATEAARDRVQAEADVHRLARVRQEIRVIQQREGQLLDERRRLRGDYNAARDAVSALRHERAKRLEAQAGGKVKITVRKNADKLSYRQIIENALKGVGVRQHEMIVETISNNLRPDDLAQIIAIGDHEELDRIGKFGTDRSRKILEGLKNSSVDALELETIPLDDEIAIELDVGTVAKPMLKDASQLSRGQKCTALLPLLLATRDSPLVIDQPEDNLDNHFIFNTVVESIRRLKPQRQMIFITHNANIPVLAEADLIAVMDSDGKMGYVKKTGNLDECKSEIIDLLEGGREAFEKRRERYGER
jgi:energy-coupling factor transporter ATP-binding protein EcfA2